ncbi:MAG: HEAT repeat domain-containing protein [Verrucomicrobia bacterium]|nr:HEAT repeat domain-containing protein [Verrucomicrobiota bacterium]
MRSSIIGSITQSLVLTYSLLILCSTSSAQDIVRATPLSGNAGAIEDWTPALKPASDAGEQAIARMRVPDDLTIRLWASEPMLGNPNAIFVDEKGRIYVAETYRYHGGVIDIRAAMGWLEEELASRTVEERILIPGRHANEAPGKEALYARDSERIVLLEDTAGLGKADKSTVFSTGYNGMKDGLGSGVFAYRGNVYYTCIPSLYLLKDTDNDGKADVKTELQYGYGIRYGFLGHDLHGMVLGPDGKLYFSVGDRSANVTRTPDGRQVANTESGSVFRCDLDGKNLEIFAIGLRNPQELRFDQYGNLFTGDNNPDKGDPARWVYVIEGGDSGWHVGYQHATRMANGGPWMAEQLWAPEANNNATYIVPNVTPLYDGPSGLAYYPGTGLPDRYADHFFLCDFRGSSGTSRINSFAVKPKGASFEVVDLQPFMQRICATDCDFGPDGAMYVSDWVEGWGRPMTGRIYKVFDSTKASDPLVRQTQKLIAEGMYGRSLSELAGLLSFQDMRVRQEAQFSLAEKGRPAIPLLSNAARNSDNLVARLHGIWGLGQIARTSPEALDAVIPLLMDKELEVRCQAAKVLGDGRIQAAYEPLLKMLSDSETRARFFAAQAIPKLERKEAIPALFEALKANRDEDAVLRYACVTALAKLGDRAALLARARDGSRAVRLGVALALRRLGDPSITVFLNDPDGQIVLEAARAINDLPITEALPELAAMLNKPLPESTAKAEKPPYTARGPRPLGTPADWIRWRAVNANFRLGTPESAKALAEFATQGDAPDALRIEALNDLGEWAKPNNLDHITTLYRPLFPRDAKPARDAANAAAPVIIKNATRSVQAAAANLMRVYGLGDSATLFATLTDRRASVEVVVTALKSLADRNDPRLKEALQITSRDVSEEVRTATIEIIGSSTGGLQQIAGLLDTGSVREKQSVLMALGSSPDPEAGTILGEWMEKMLAKQVPAELQLELLEAATKSRTGSVQDALSRFQQSVTANDPLGSYRETLGGGDAERGQKIFRERAEVSCIRCHVARGEGGTVGPLLDGIGTRQNREYLLESMIHPNAKIAPGFESLIVQLTDGTTRTGILKKEDASELT